MRAIWRLMTLGCVLAMGVGLQNAAAADPARGYLAGDWAFDDKNGPAPCGAPASRGMQVAFEFARSGGRAVFYEAADLYTVVGGVEIVGDGDSIVMTSKTREGAVQPFAEVRRVDADTAQFIFGGAMQPATIRRCKTEPYAAASLSDASLFALSPNVTGGHGFRQILAGETVPAVCDATDSGADRGWMQLELIAPAHRWIMFDGLRGMGDFWTITAVRETAPGLVKLSLKSWDPDEAPKTLSFRITADAIEVPELNVRFARCAADKETSRGMHRW